ncbi:MAG: DUF5916 domain-containing protein [Gemmatimonadota bacterium]
MKPNLLIATAQSLVPWLVVSLSMSGAEALGAQEARLIPRLTDAVVLDGRVDEVAWARVRPLPLVVFAPEYGADPSQHTEIRLAHDETYLYLSARCFETDPTAIRANALVRDEDGDDDFVNLVIDTFHDRENAVWFLVTPLGARVDGAITANAEGSAWNHFEYDSFWDAATSRDGRGWSAEMRIPLTSLRFHRDMDGSVTMGVIAGRYISRSGERHVFPDIRPGPAVAQYKPSLAAPLRMEGVDDRTPLYVRPYALAGTEQVMPAPGADPEDTRSLVREIGGDAKLGLSSNLTLDLTLNTDFAQTEIDDAQVNLTRYDLLKPEKRSFFLERSGTFSLDAGDDIHLFHSRRIGLDPGGSPLRVLGGARLVGRLGQWDVGALDLQTDGPEGQGTANQGVLRVRRNVGAMDSYVGGIVTASTHGTSRWTGGLDGVLKLVGDSYLSFEAGLTPTNNGHVSSEETLGRVRLERRNKRGWSYSGEVAYIGSRFDPALGFVRRAGLTTGALGIEYGRFGGGTFQSSGVRVKGSVARRNDGGGIESAQAGVTWFGDRRGGGGGQLNLTWRHEGVLEPFRLGNAVIPAGSHDYVEGGLTLETPNGRAAWSTVEVSGGAFFDGYRATAAIVPTWTVSRYLLLSGAMEVNRIWFPSRDQGYTAYVTRARARVSPDTHLSVNVLVQRNNATGMTGGNMRFRYMIREGTDVYLVFTTGHLDLASVPLGSPRSRNSIVLKFSTTVR